MTRTTISTFRPFSVDVTGPEAFFHVEVAEDVPAWFTGANLAGVPDANLAHHVPHRTNALAAARRHVAERTATEVASWHFMRQVHGANVAVIDASTPAGAELRDVDILVTTLVDRPLVTLSADCLPILAAGERAVAAAHAGWRGIVAGVPDALVDALVGTGEHEQDLRILIGPAIGPCCYAVGPEVCSAITAQCPDAASTTRDGEASVDLRLAVQHRLEERGVLTVLHVGGRAVAAPACTACDPRYFSHRRDPRAGRQAGIIVRRSSGRAHAVAS